MLDQNTILNTCYQFITSQPEVVSMVKYSHIIPIFFSLILGIFVLIKAKFNLLSKVFFSFIFTFSLWLIGDLIVWTSYNYNLIPASWAPLDFIEIIFYFIGLYFILIFTNKKDISKTEKVLFFLLIIPAFVVTIINKSVLGFNQSFCEAIGNEGLSLYKIIIEIIFFIIMIISMIKLFIKKFSQQHIYSSQVMIGSMFLFLLIFSITEYIASTTGFFQLHLYSLFLLPILLLVITYSVFELDIFNFKILGTQYLVVGLVILVVGQLFFVNGNTDRLLTILTVIITVGLSILLYRNLKKETDQRLQIENLSGQLVTYNEKLKTANDKLKSLDKLKTEFVSLASHQLRGPLTAIKGYASMLADGDYGKVSDEAKEAVDRIYQSSRNLSIVVEDLLNVTKIEAGGMKYEMAPFNLYQVVKDEAKDFSIASEKKGLKLDFEEDNEDMCMVNADKEKIRQVIINFMDNAIKYTKEGIINVSIKYKDGKIIFSVKDTGMGITEEIKESLFQKFARGEGARMNTTGSGLGLYLAKEIASAHKGRVWVESEGMGKGSTFYLELNAIDK